MNAITSKQTKAERRKNQILQQELFRNTVDQLTDGGRMELATWSQKLNVVYRVTTRTD